MSNRVRRRGNARAGVSLCKRLLGPIEYHFACADEVFSGAFARTLECTGQAQTRAVWIFVRVAASI